MATAPAYADLRLRTVFHFAGCSWELSTNSPVLAESLRDAFPRTGKETRARFHLDIQVSGSDAPLWEVPYFRGRDQLVLAAFSATDVLLFDLLQNRAVGTLSPALARDEHYLRCVIVPVLIGVVSASVGVAPLHCATLVRDGMGLHISGLSGAGKSTLAYALGQRGFALLSDDWTYFHQGPKALVASGLPVPIKLLPDTRRFFPRLGAHPITRSLNGELAYEIDVRSALSPSRTYSCDSRRLLFYRRVPGAAATFTRLTPQQAEAQFGPALERIPDCLASTRAGQHSIIAALSHIPAYSLIADGRPQEIARLIEEWTQLPVDGEAGVESLRPPPHFEVPDLMLRFAPTPLLSIRSGAGGRILIETDLPSIHEYSSELSSQLARFYGPDLHCTFVADRADWSNSAAALDGFSYRFIAAAGCVWFDPGARRLVAFLSPEAAANRVLLRRLIAPVTANDFLSACAK